MKHIIPVCIYQEVLSLSVRKVNEGNNFLNNQPRYLLVSHARLKINMYRAISTYLYLLLSHDVASRSDITPCNKIDKPLVVYTFGKSPPQFENWPMCVQIGGLQIFGKRNDVHYYVA